MPLPPIVENKSHVIKVAAHLSSEPERDALLMALFLGSPCSTLELNRIQVGDVLGKSGKLKKEMLIRGDSERDFYLSNKKLQAYLLAYLNNRVSRKLGMGEHPDYYLGLDPDSALFISTKGRDKGRGFAITGRRTPKGNMSYSCSSLNRHIRELLNFAGIEEPSVNSGRRTFAVTLKRKGFDEPHIHTLLGNKSLKTTKKLLATDTLDMSVIAREAF